MTILSQKFDVLRGWTPGGDTPIDHSFPPALSGGSPVQLPAGTFVVLGSDGTVDVPGATSATILPYYCVVAGNDDFDGQYVEKVVTLKGTFTIRTDKFEAAQTFTVGTGVAVSANGLLADVSTNYRVGTVVADNRSTNGTIDVDVTL